MEDTGTGVPPCLRETIFEDYESHQVDGAVQAGTGLGLSLCRGLVRLMGGELTLECPPSGGSVFSFTLAFIRATPPPVEASPGSSAGPAPLPAGLRVLVADDLKINRIVLRHALEKILPAAKFKLVATAEEALQLICASPAPGVRPFDLAVIDETFVNGHGETGMGGVELTRNVRDHEAAVRERGGPQHRVVIVGHTGHAGPQHNAVAIEAGQDFVWGKPLPDQEALTADLAPLLSASPS